MKQKIVLLIAMFCYWTGIVWLFYKLNRHGKRIITFHNVIPESLFPDGQIIGLTNTEETFRSIIRVIKSHFNISTDVLDSTTATLTFDDGYKNQLEVAGKILNEEGEIPAIVFIAGRMIDNNNEFDCLIVDRLLHWTWLAPCGHYSITQDTTIVFEMTKENRTDIWEYVIWPAFCNDFDSKGERLMDQLDKQYGNANIMNVCDGEYTRLRLQGIGAADMERYEKKGWLFGWHTQNHYPLSKLSTKEKREEIKPQTDKMKSIVFSYPYGELESVDAECLHIAEIVGYPSAVSNVGEANLLMGKFFIPRMMLSSNFYLCNLELCGLKYFLKTRRLLPILKKL